jgi:hypothetical protein
VITSLVSLEYGVYGCERVTSQRHRYVTLERCGVTSLRDISFVGGHVICRYSDDRYNMAALGCTTLVIHCNAKKNYEALYKYK